MDKKWNIDLASIRDEECVKTMTKRWNAALQIHEHRTRLHEIFGRVSHNMSLFYKKRKDMWSEGSSQAIKRKAISQSLQRVPDGELLTQHDKNSIQQVEHEFLFSQRIMKGEVDGEDMLKLLTRTMKMGWDYCNGCVRHGFKMDYDGDVRTTYTLLGWNDVLADPDCKYIEEAEWYMVREYISRSALEQLIDEETGEIYDSTYNADVIKFILESDLKDGVWPRSQKMADRDKGVTPIESVEIRTWYRKGADTFKTYVPAISAVLREVPNEDPRKGVPLHFLILEPDPDFPLGVSSVMWTLAEQQFADAFHALSGQALLLSLNPPILAYGNLTQANMEMKPNAIWNMGTNQNNKAEKFPVETTTLTQRAQIMESISATMLRSVNITDQTVASDAGVKGWSNTPQGVEMQRQDRTISMNQYMKRMEVFFAQLTNSAYRSYLNSMGGKVWMTVDERTRRRVLDIESQMYEEDPFYESIIDGTKIRIDFDELNSDMFSFEVRTGSLIENIKEEELRSLREMIAPLPQMVAGLSDQNKPVFEQVMLQILARMAELTNVDISVQVAGEFQDALARQAVQATMEEVMMMRQQMMQLQQPQQPPMLGAPPQPGPEVSAEFPEAQAGVAQGVPM